MSFSSIFCRRANSLHSCEFLVSSFLVDQNGNPVTEAYDEAIPVAVITQLTHLQVAHGLTLEDAITCLHQKLVPNGYQLFPFKVDTPESFLAKLRSLVKTYCL